MIFQLWRRVGKTIRPLRVNKGTTKKLISAEISQQIVRRGSAKRITRTAQSWIKLAELASAGERITDLLSPDKDRYMNPELFSLISTHLRRLGSFNDGFSKVTRNKTRRYALPTKYRGW